MTQEKDKQDARHIGDNSFADNDSIYEAAYKKMRVVCQIVHNRLLFLQDNLDEARNGKRLVDRVEGLSKARGEVKFIHTHTEPLQATYHGYKDDESAVDNYDVELIADKHGQEIAAAEKLILDLKNANHKASALAQDRFVRGEEKSQNKTVQVKPHQIFGLKDNPLADNDQ